MKGFFLKGSILNIDRFFRQSLFIVAALSVLTASTGGLLVGMGFHIGIIRNFFVLILLFFFLIYQKFENNLVNRSVLLLSIYLLLLIPFSSNPSNSLYAGYLRMIPHMLMFLVAFKYIKSYKSLYQLSFLYAILLSPVVINMIIGQAFFIGHSAYVEGTFYLGYSRIGITNLIPVMILFSLIYVIKNRKNKLTMFVFYVFISISIVFILFTMKRTGLVALLISFTIFFIYMPGKPKSFVTVVFASLIIGGVLSVTGTFDSIFKPRYEARVGENRPIEEEGRTKDIQYSVIEFVEGDIWHKLFGSELFNSQQFFGPKYYGRERMIHGDLTKIFYGAGIVGLLLYLNVFRSLFLFYKNIFKFLPKSRDLFLYRAVFNGILFSYFAMLVPGVGQSATSITYIALGAIMGANYHELRKHSQPDED